MPSAVNFPNETIPVQTAAFPVRRFEIFILLFACVFSSLWCVTSARELSATFDEPFYIEAGLQRWRTGSYHVLMRYGTMPLPVDVQTLPLYLWEKACGVPFDATADFQTILPYARAGNLIFWWMLLTYVWLTARSLAGPWAGVVGLLFLALEPSLLAHASLATTDIAATACFFALIYHFQRNREEKSWWWRVAWPGLWFGLAVLAKAYGLVFGGLCLFVLEGVRHSWWRSRPRSEFWDSVRHIRHIVSIGLIVLFVYVGSDWQPEKSFVKWARTLPEGAFGSSMLWIAENLRIFNNAGVGLARQVTHNVRGHGSFLLDETHRRALWYYFPVLLSIKLTVPLLLGVVFLGFKQLRSRTWKQNWPLQAALAIFLFSPFCRVQIGIRFMFPMMALAIAGLAPILIEAIRDASSIGRKRLLSGISVGCLAWAAVAAFSVWPHGLCYVNPLWGGTASGYRLVSEGNYDWGQGVKELVKWQEKNEFPNLDVWCFSTDPIKNRLPRLIDYHSISTTSKEDFLRLVKGRRLAVSVTFLYGAYQGQSFDVARAVLRPLTPMARTATYLIYDFTGEVGAKEGYTTLR